MSNTPPARRAGGSMTIDRRRFLGSSLAAIGGVFLPSIPWYRRGSGLIAPIPAREWEVLNLACDLFHTGDTICIHGEELEYFTIVASYPTPSKVASVRMGVVTEISPTCLTINAKARHLSLPFARQAVFSPSVRTSPASRRRPRF